jgi:hypothetical protein
MNTRRAEGFVALLMVVVGLWLCVGLPISVWLDVAAGENTTGEGIILTLLGLAVGGGNIVLARELRKPF